MARERCGDASWRRNFIRHRCAATFAQRVHNEEKGMVAWTIADKSWLPAAKNWVTIMRRLVGATHIAAVSLDAPSALVFEQHGVPVLKYSCGCGGMYAPASLLLLKASVTLELLEQGSRVLFSEMDVFWRRPPLLVQNARYDFQVASHAQSTELQLGMFIAQPRRAALLRALELMIPWAVDPQVEDCEDQKVWDYAISGSSLLSLACRRRDATTRAELPLNEPSLRDATSSSLRWGRLPYDRLPHPLGGLQGCPLLPSNASAHAVAIRVFAEAGGPMDRIRIAKLWGFWQQRANHSTADASATTAVLPHKLRNETLCMRVREGVPEDLMSRFRFAHMPPGAAPTVSSQSARSATWLTRWCESIAHLQDECVR